MAKQYLPDISKDIRRIVKNFNQKRLRAIQRGYSYVPEKQFVSAIKRNYPTKPQLQSYLKKLAKYNQMGRSAHEIVTTKGGGRISRYNLEFLKSNLKYTRDFFDKEIAEAEILFGDNPYSIARKDYLLNLQEKRNYLNQNIMDLSQSGLTTFTKYMNMALTSESTKAASYRGFMGGIDDIMGNLGYSKQEINALYAKLNNLTPAQFVKMYRQNDIIGRLYDLIPSPAHGKEAINLNDRDARVLIDNFLNNFDSMVDEAMQFGQTE